MIGLAGSPFGFAFGQLRVSQFYVKCSDDGVDFDDIAVAQQCDRPAHGRFRPDMADAEPAGRPGEPSVGDQRDLAAHALPGQRRRGREHFPHPGTAAGPLIADHDDLALFVGLLLHRLEGILFAIEATRGAGKFQIRHAPDLHDRALRRKISLQPDHYSSDGDLLVGGMPPITLRRTYSIPVVLRPDAAHDRLTFSQSLYY